MDNKEIPDVIDIGDLPGAPVPEPSALLVFGVGLALVGALSRRR